MRRSPTTHLVLEETGEVDDGGVETTQEGPRRDQEEDKGKHREDGWCQRDVIASHRHHEHVVRPDPVTDELLLVVESAARGADAELNSTSSGRKRGCLNRGVYDEGVRPDICENLIHPEGHIAHHPLWP